jgi:hypothetical protein
VHRHRQHHVHVVTLAPEDRMRRHVHGDVEIARRPAAETRIAFAGHADARAVGDARGDPYGYRLAPHFLADASAWFARARPLPAGAGAPRAASGKHHVPAHGTDGAGALAHMTWAGGRARTPAPFARAAHFAAGQRHLVRDPGERVLEAELQSEMQVGTAFGCFLRCAAIGEHFREQIAEGHRLVTAPGGKIESFEAAGPAAAPVVGAASARVVPRAAVGIHQRLVCLEDLPEAGFGHAVAGIDVRMKPPGEPPVGALDLRLRRAGRQSEHYIQVHTI